MSRPFTDSCKNCGKPVSGVTDIAPSHKRKVFSSRETMRLVGLRLKDGSGCLCVVCFRGRFSGWCDKKGSER